MTFRPEIDPYRAREYRRRGLTWPEIAYALSRDAKRVPPFVLSSVQNAVHREFGTLKTRRDK